MPRLRNKSMRYRFLAIVMVLAAGSLSSCQQSSGTHSIVVSQAPKLQNAALPIQNWQSLPLQHATLHVPR